MSAIDFENFVRRQQEKQQQIAKLDVQAELRDWRARLETLYETIKNFMSGYVESGAASIDRRQVTLREEFSGAYDVDEMLLSIGPSQIVFQPVGTMLIGSKGRVDVKGPRGIERLVLVDRQLSRPSQLIKVSVSRSDESDRQTQLEEREPDWTWKIVTRGPDMRFLELDEQAFFDLVLAVADA